MKNHYFLRYFLVCLVIEFSSCDISFKEDDKIFHGAPEHLGIGGLSFGLYKDKRYQITNSGGIGYFSYSGSYIINEDTIILNNLSKELKTNGLFESNRLAIFRYNEQDSTYWEWKDSRQYKSLTADKTLGPWLWKKYKSTDTVLGEGDVYQIDSKGIPMGNAYHFIIRLDSLKNYR